jgi:hypothetical protein
LFLPPFRTKIGLSAFILTVIVFAGFSQKLDIRGFGGFNSSSLTNDYPPNYKIYGKTGFQTGVSITYGEMFYINPGVYWSNFSFEVEETLPDGTVEKNKPNVSMISFPIIVGFRLIPPDLVNIVNVRVFGGLRGNHLTNIKNKDGNKDYSTSDFNNMLMTFDVGMGVDIFSFYIDAGYGIGLSPVFVEGGNGTKMNNFYMNFGVRLRLN